MRVTDMNHKFSAFFLTALLPGLSFGQSSQAYQCTYGDLQRRVEILYETGVAVPCEVHYYKDTEEPGEQQVLWRALNEFGYCERKTEELIINLQGWGWTCGKADDAGPKAEPEQADDPGPGGEPALGDDTGALKPAEETESTEDG
jgi:hypothetical protein